MSQCSKQKQFGKTLITKSTDHSANETFIYTRTIRNIANTLRADNTNVCENHTSIVLEIGFFVYELLVLSSTQL